MKTTGRKWTECSQLLNLCVQPWLRHITVRIMRSHELYVQCLDLIAYYLCLFISFSHRHFSSGTWYRSYILGWEMFVIQYCVAVLLLFLSALQRLLLAVFRRSCFLLPVSLHGKLVSICAFQVVMCFSALSSILFLHFILFFSSVFTHLVRNLTLWF